MRGGDKAWGGGGAGGGVGRWGAVGGGREGVWGGRGAKTLGSWVAVHTAFVRNGEGGASLYKVADGERCNSRVAGDR